MAMRVSSNHSIFYRCSFEASQDTLQWNLTYNAMHTRSRTWRGHAVHAHDRVGGLARGAHTRSRTWFTHAVSHAVRILGVARGACTRSHVHMVAHAVAYE